MSASVRSSRPACVCFLAVRILRPVTCPVCIRSSVTRVLCSSADVRGDSVGTCIQAYQYDSEHTLIGLHILF